MINQPASSKFQIIIQPHNSYFLKKNQFWEKYWLINKNDYFGENPNLSKLIWMEWNEMQNDMASSTNDDWS